MWERNTNPLPLTCAPMGTKPATQACTLTGNRTYELLVSRMMPKQGYTDCFLCIFSLSSPILQIRKLLSKLFQVKQHVAELQFQSKQFCTKSFSPVVSNYWIQEALLQVFPLCLAPLISSFCLKGCLIVVLICNSRMTNEFEYISMVLFVFLLLICRNAVYSKH